jgi:hypothetical protein
LGHTLRRLQGSITYQALSWNPQGKREEEEDPKNMRRRELKTEIKRTGLSWKDLEKMALDKMTWRDLVADPNLHGATG